MATIQVKKYNAGLSYFAQRFFLFTYSFKFGITFYFYIK